MVCNWNNLDKLFDKNIRCGLWIVWGVAGIIGVFMMVVYDHISKRFVLPIGIIGWILTITLWCYWSWFGPGAYGHK